MIIAPILSTISVELNIAEDLLGTLVTAYAVALAAIGLCAGPISDRIGRRRVLVAGTGAMALALALHQIASDYVTFLLVRGA